jgi:hypothetical protein
MSLKILYFANRDQFYGMYNDRYACHIFSFTGYVNKSSRMGIFGNTSFYLLSILVAARGGAVGSGTALQAGFPMESLEIFIDLIHPTALWPWG